MATNTETRSRRLNGMTIDGSREIVSPPAKRNSTPPSTGPNGQAKILPMDQVPALFTWLDQNLARREAVVAKLMFSLSFYAALRACEMARLTWREVTDCNGNIDTWIHVTRSVAKKKRPREIWLHPRIRQELKEWRRCFPMAQHLALGADDQPRSTNALTVWFHRTYQRMGLSDCSSHSGRRSLITYLANNCGREGMSLRDVQIIAGHASIATTEAYIHPSPNPGLLIKSVPWRPAQFEQLPAGLAPEYRAPLPVAVEELSAFRWAAGLPADPPTDALILARHRA